MLKKNADITNILQNYIVQCHNQDINIDSQDAQQFHHHKNVSCPFIATVTPHPASGKG